MHFRHDEEEVARALQPGYRISLGDVHEISCDDGPAPLRLRLHGEATGFAQQALTLDALQYRAEAERGYAHEGRL